MEKRYTLSGSSARQTLKSAYSRSGLFALLLVVLFQFLTQKANSQVYTIGTGTTTTYQVPINNLWGYSYNQTIYPAALLTAQGMTAGMTITQIAWYVNTANTSTLNAGWTIYLGNTTQTAFASTTNWVASTALTQVFSGTYIPSPAGWVTVTLATPFVWNGQNLVVAVDENTATYSYTATMFRYTAGAANSSIMYYSDATNPSPTAPPTALLRNAFLPNIQLTASVATACSGTPNTGAAAINVSSGCANTSVNLSASGLSTGTGISYQWQSSLDGGVTWNNIVGATGTTCTTVATATTRYRIRTTCVNSGVTSASSPASFTVTASGVCSCGAYPALYATSTADEEISSVTVGSMTNTSACGTLATGSGSVAYQYSNYSGVVTGPTAMQGSTVNFSLTQTTCGGAYANYFQIYVDWNQDGDWLDAGEQVYSQAASVTGNQTATGSFTVPMTATAGTTRMRVVVVETTAGTTNYAHTAYSWGESEDYCFTVSVAVGCTGTPNAGVAALSSSSGCLGAAVTVSATGITSGTGISYQWQSSTDAVTWTNIVGATSSSYSASPTVSTYYRLVTTCSNSGLTNSSSSILYTVNCFQMGASGSSVTACSGTLYDTGGTGDYGNSVNSTITIYPSTPGNVVRLNFSAFATENNWDGLVIYNGNTTAAPIISSGLGAGTGSAVNCPAGSFYGTVSPGQITSSAADGSLTLQFRSDGSGVAAGFTAAISCVAPCVTTGDQTSYGAGSWIGYVYDAATAGAFTTYKGIITEATTFNRTHTTIASGATAPHCSQNVDLFTIRYKNLSNLPAGYYTFSVGGDDGVRFSIDGGLTWLINNWVDQGYTVSSNPTQVYLSGNTNMVFEYYENTGGAQSSFSYIYTPACSGTPTPGNTLASSTQVISGGTTNLSLQNSTAPATYQWQSSTSSTGPWTAIAGATGATYTATVTANTWFNCVVTCTTTSTSASSNPVQVTLAYCASGATSTADEEIYSVTINGGSTNAAYANANGCTTVAPGPGSVLSSYSNFTTLAAITTLNQGQSVSFSISENECDAGTYYSNGCAIWIDWNQDADFNDAGEQVFVEAATALGPRTIAGSFIVPATAVPGNTRMRIIVAEGYSGATLTPCLSYGYGETEDHLISISVPPACSGTPAPGATTASTTAIFAGGTTNLGLTTYPTGSGITYVWQSSTSASGPWTTIAGATSSSYTAAPTANTYYQCIVTCATGSVSGTSTPILISVNPYCNPAYTYGTVDGDLISNVIIAGTTLSNNTGTTAGLSYYNFYTGQANYTANLVAANSYNVSVTAGSFTNQNFAAWIDYNDNNLFEASEKIGFSTAATVAAFETVNFAINLSCTPPLGPHRMRVRGVYATAGSTIDPCATYGWGETEDYVITIVAGAAFTPTFTTTPTTPNCVGAQVTYTAAAGQTNYAWTFPGTAGVDYTLISGGNSTSNTAVVTYNTSGSNTITMNYASPLGCASSGAINNTITVGAGTFTTTAAAGDVIWRGATSTDWSTASNWYSFNGTSYSVASGVPSPATRTIIPANNTCVLAQPAVNIVTAGSAKDVIIETGATLTMTTGTLNVSGNFVNNGTFVAGTGKVAFNAAGTVSGNATTFNDVDLNNGVNFGSNLSTINGILTMNTGSWVNTNAPIYGTSSLLKYNTGGTYGRGFEWSTTSGAGYPNDVQVSNNTTINYPNTGGAFSANIGLRRDLTIDAGSNLYMDYGTGNASGSLTVGRNVTSAGDLSLGNQIGGDIYVGGNWTRTTGNLYANNRAVFFNGATGNQTITKTGGETFPYMVVNKAAGNVILANNVTTTGGLTLTSGLVEVGTNNFVMGGSSLTGGSTASYVKTASTGTLSRNVAGTATTFPVGNTTYNAAILTNNGTTDVFSARVIDNVTLDGTGVGTTTTEAVVKRTWMIEEATAGGTNATLRLYWNGAGEEINTFSAATAFMAHYVAAAGLWDNIGGTVGAGYVETSNNMSFSPFTISSSTTFAPLPVELISLGAQCSNEDVIVSWSTASEHNTLNFIVERSENGLNWNEVQTVAAAMNSNTVREYAIEDAGAARGLKYYRLVQTDQDGVQKVYGPVMTNCGTETELFMSFPNPSDADITLVFNSKKINGSTTLMVRDAHGRVVRSIALEIQPGTDSMLIPDMELTPGVYYLQLEGESFKTPVIKHSLR